MFDSQVCLLHQVYQNKCKGRPEVWFSCGHVHNWLQQWLPQVCIYMYTAYLINASQWSIRLDETGSLSASHLPYSVFHSLHFSDLRHLVFFLSSHKLLKMVLCYKRLYLCIFIQIFTQTMMFLRTIFNIY